MFTNILPKIKKYFEIIGDLSIVSPREKSIFTYFKKSSKTNNKEALDTVLVQCVEDLLYFGLFGQMLCSLRNHKAIRVEQFVFNSLRPQESISITAFIHSRIMNIVLRRKWVALYNSFCDGEGYRSAGFNFSMKDVIDGYRSFKRWKELDSKDDLISLVIDGVAVGDLVNDSYLRFKPAPTVNIRDKYLWFIIWQTYRDIRKAREYFTRVKPKLYLTSYSSGYIQHGVAVRVGLQLGVKVFAVFGNYQDFLRKLTLEDWRQTKNTDHYATSCLQDNMLESNLALAERALSARLDGHIDNSISYMKSSAYHEREEFVPDVEGAVVIFLHDFFDAPHVYRKMVFPDFWEWACFTVEALQREGIRFLIKPHPSQSDASAAVVERLKQRYPELAFISSGVTNKQLAFGGIACAVTVHGTIAHELAYLGVPTVACGDHPHVSFQFCLTANDKAEYIDYLCNFNKYSLNKSELRKQSLMFYYMHNLSYSNNEKNLMDSVFSYVKCCGNLDTSKDPLGILMKIADLPSFQLKVSELASEV